MSEHAFATRPYAEDYQQVLEQYPDMHDDLAAHVRRLAEQEGSLRAPDSVSELQAALPIAGSLPDVSDYAPPQPENVEHPVDNALPGPEQTAVTPGESAFQALLGHMDTFTANVAAGTHNPDTERYSIYLTKIKELPGEEHFTERIADYLHALRSTADASPNNRDGFYRSAASVLKEIPIDTLRHIYSDPTLASDLQIILKESVAASWDRHPETHAKEEVELLMDIYDYADPLDMIAMSRGPQGDDPVVETFLRKPGAKEALASYIKEDGPYWRGKMPILQSEARRDWADRFFDTVAGLPDTLREDIMFAAYSRISTPPARTLLDTQEAFDLLTEVTANIEAIGVESALELRAQAGMTNFDYYKTDQLTLMSKFVKGDEEAIRHLQAGDVTVVFLDGTGDYNGTLKSDSENFATANGRTLFFEINRPTDFYRHMALLKKRGIKPSTLVLSGHGAPGVMSFGSSARGKFKIRNYTDENASTGDYEVADAYGIARIASEFMQDSRGIDDATELKGRRTLILALCKQSAPKEIPAPASQEQNMIKTRRWRLRPRPKVHPRATAVAPQSMAESILRRTGNKRLDIYAGSKNLSIGRTDRGVEMIDDKQFPATRFRLGRFGKLLVTDHEEIVLRNE